MNIFTKRFAGIASIASVALALISPGIMAAPELVVINANITAADTEQYRALSVENGVFSEFSNRADALLSQADNNTIVIDAKGKRLIAGINDSHLHVTRGGRFYNLETRWEGVTSLKAGLEMLKAQAEHTPKSQWVRVVGGKIVFADKQDYPEHYTAPLKAEPSWSPVNFDTQR